MNYFKKFIFLFIFLIGANASNASTSKFIGVIGAAIGNIKNQNNELGGYIILNNKKITLISDVGSSPDKKFSSNYQAGSLSFEIISNGKKYKNSNEKILFSKDFFKTMSLQQGPIPTPLNLENRAPAQAPALFSLSHPCPKKCPKGFQRVPPREPKVDQK